MSAQLPQNPHAVRYHATGKPEEVLQFEAVPVTEPAADEVVVAMETAVIHPSDLGMIGGTYGRLRPLPAVAGREAIGRVAKTGAAVTSFKIGDRVKMPEDAGVWRDAVVAKASDLLPVPADLPAEQACMAFINPPTAWLVLHEFVQLQPGDWVIQNAGNSAVGECVAQLARSLGLHTVCLVRSPEKHEARLKSLGADIVLADDKNAGKTLAGIWKEKGVKGAKLALNSIGGDSVATLSRALDDNGVLVTFGGMVGDPMRFPTREFIFKNISFRGFWMDRWARTHSPEEVKGVFDAIFQSIRTGALKMAVDSVYPLAEYKSALARAGGYARDGKVLLKGPAA